MHAHKYTDRAGFNILGTLRSTTTNLDDGISQTKEFFIQNKKNK